MNVSELTGYHDKWKILLVVTRREIVYSKCSRLLLLEHDLNLLFGSLQKMLWNCGHCSYVIL